MSDLGTIGIVVEVKGRDALRQIQSDMDAVDRSTKTAAQSFAAFERAGLKSANTFKYMAQETKDWLRDQQRILSIKDQSEKIAQKQAQAEAKITAEIVKQRQASEQAAAASARAYQSQIGGNLGLGAQGISAGASASAMSAEIDKLSQKYDRVFAANKLYEQQVQELTRAEMLGVISKQKLNKELSQLDLELNQFVSAAEGASIANNRFSSHINESSRGLNKFGFAAQQVGYQVGDFFVQIQSGTNPMVAFGQQATQLAGLLPGVLGAALGIGISLATAIGSTFMRASSEVETSSDRQVIALKKLEEAYREVQSEIDKFRFGESATAYAENEIKNLETQISGISNTIQMLTANIENAKDSQNFEAALIARDLAQAEIAAGQESLAILQKKLVNLQDMQEAQFMLNGGLSVAGGLNRAAIRDKQFELRAQQELKKFVDLTVTAVKTLANSQPGDSWLGSAIANAGTLATKLWDAVKANAALANSQMDTGNADWAKSGLGFTLKGEELLGLPSAPNGGSSGGGGGGSAGNAGLETLINSLQTEREVIDQWYAESQASLQSASDAELAIIGGRHEAELRLEEEHQKRLAGIKEAGNKSMLETTLSGAGEILSALGAFNDKALRISKVFAAAEALVSTYQGAAAELKKGVLGFGTAAAVIAKGIGFVAAIKGVSSSGTTSGTSSGGGRGSATVPTTTAQATPQTVYIDSISPESLYTGQTLINLFDAFYSENDKRGKVFVVGK